MDFIVFKQKVMAGVQEFLGEEVKIEENRVTKNNGVILDGISIMKAGINISPTIYLNDFYEEYKSGEAFGSIVSQIAKVYDETQVGESMDMKFFLDYSKVKGKIVFRLVNYEKNREQLQKMPHIPYLDLAVVFSCMVMNDRIGSASIQIMNSHCGMWEVTEKQLYEAAMRNTPKYLRARITGMDELLKSIFSERLRGELEKWLDSHPGEAGEITPQWIENMAKRRCSAALLERPEAMMYVLSNSTKQNGAACILYPNLLKRFAAGKNENFYILPSSVHEVILVPDRGEEEPGRLKDMVREVNTTQVEEEEILSDAVYYYNRLTDTVSML